MKKIANRRSKEIEEIIQRIIYTMDSMGIEDTLERFMFSCGYTIALTDREVIDNSEGVILLYML